MPSPIVASPTYPKTEPTEEIIVSVVCPFLSLTWYVFVARSPTVKFADIPKIVAFPALPAAPPITRVVGFFVSLSTAFWIVPWKLGLSPWLVINVSTLPNKRPAYVVAASSIVIVTSVKFVLLLIWWTVEFPCAFPTNPPTEISWSASKFSLPSRLANPTFKLLSITREFLKSYFPLVSPNIPPTLSSLDIPEFAVIVKFSTLTLLILTYEIEVVLFLPAIAPI